MKITLELTGFQQALKDLKKLRRGKERTDALKKAMRAAGAKMLIIVRRLLRPHKRSGWLSRTNKSKLKYYKKTDTLALIVGVQSNAETSYNGRKIVSHKYEHFLRLGRKGFYQGRFSLGNRSGFKSVWIGPVKPLDFIGIAAKQSRAPALQAAQKALLKVLNARNAP